jgi:hypothetical protein
MQCSESGDHRCPLQYASLQVCLKAGVLLVSLASLQACKFSLPIPSLMWWNRYTDSVRTEPFSDRMPPYVWKEDAVCAGCGANTPKSIGAPSHVLWGPAAQTGCRDLLARQRMCVMMRFALCVTEGITVPGACFQALLLVHHHHHHHVTQSSHSINAIGSATSTSGISSPSSGCVGPSGVGVTVQVYALIWLCNVCLRLLQVSHMPHCDGSACSCLICSFPGRARRPMLLVLNWCAAR